MDVKSFFKRGHIQNVTKLAEHVQFVVGYPLTTIEQCHAVRFSDNKMLHERQVAIISDFQQTVEGGESGVKQMIMGAGKTTVVSPLLSMLLDQNNST